MKKVLSSLFTAVLMLCCGIWLSACGNQKFDVGFEQTQITLEIGQTYDPFDFVATSLSDKQKDKVQFKTENAQVVYVDANKMLVPINAGQTTIYAQVQKETVASCIVNVPALPIVLSAPTNLHFDEENYQLEWNYSYYELDGALHTNAKYVLEISKDGGAFEKHEIENTNVFEITEPRSYAYAARIQAVAASSAFESSAFSDPINFNLMGKPTNLAFDPATKTLFWQDNSNPASTKYNIEYTLNGGTKQTVSNVEGKSFVFDDADVGVHTFKVITVPQSSTYFKNQSDVLQVEQLGQVNPTFNNGTLSWNALPSASGYQVQIFLDGTLFEEEVVTSATSTLPKTACTIPSKNYEVCVQPLGDSQNVFDGKTSQKLAFEKLPLAEVVYHQSQNAFEVANASFAASWIKLSSQNQTLVGTASLAFTAQNAAPYHITAQLTATKAAEQIDGDISTTFTVGDVSTFQTIQNLSEIAISYAEQGENAFVQYIEREPDCTYTISQNGQKLELVPANNAFALGSVVELFATLSQHTFSVFVEKEPTQTAFFVPASESLGVQKLSAPTTLTLDGINVKVLDNLPQGASHVGYTINGEATNILNTTLAVWDITARFVAQSTPISVPSGENEISMFYSTGASTYFQIKRLDKVDGLKFDYTNKTLVFNTVLEANNYVGVCGTQNVFSTTEASVTLDNVVGKVLVSAHPAAWAPITTGTVGYIESLPSEITIYQIADIQKLWLAQNADETVTAKWTAPEETYGKDVAYSVFVKYQDEDFILEQNNITANEFTFDKNRFDGVGDYTIKVQLDSPNKDFLATQTNHSLKLSRLAAPTTLSRNGNALKITDFNAANMLGVVVKQNLDGVESIETQNHDTITMNLQDSQTLTISIKFLGEFDASVNKYNLSSLESTYLIHKLGTLTSLKFENVYEKQFKFSWVPFEQDENGTVPNFVNYQYYTSNNKDKFTTNQKFATVADYTGTPFTFFVREVATSASWLEIAAGESQYLSSDTYQEVQVYQEAQITNLTATINGDEVNLSWKHKYVEAYVPNQGGYAPMFNLVYTNKTTQATHTNYLRNLEYIDGEGAFEYTYSIQDDFADAGQYTIAISAVSITKTLQSVPVAVTLNKLPAITNLTLNENLGTFVNADASALDETGVANLVVSGALEQVNGANIDLSTITSGTRAQITVYRKAQVGEVGILNYYLDSAPATFTLVRLENQDVVV